MSKHDVISVDTVHLLYSSYTFALQIADARVRKQPIIVSFVVCVSLATITAISIDR